MGLNHSCLKCSTTLPSGTIDPFCRQNLKCERLSDLHTAFHFLLRSPNLNKNLRRKPTDENLQRLIQEIGLTLWADEVDPRIYTNQLSSGQTLLLLKWSVPYDFLHRKDKTVDSTEWKNFSDWKCGFCCDLEPLDLNTLGRLFQLTPKADRRYYKKMMA